MTRSMPDQPSPTGAGFLTNICRGQIAKLVEERKKNSPGGREGKPAARMPRMSVAVGSNSKPSSEQQEVVESSDATDAMAMAAAEVLEDLVEGEEEEEDEPAAGDSFAANAAAEVQLEVQFTLPPKVLLTGRRIPYSGAARLHKQGAAGECRHSGGQRRHLAPSPLAFPHRAMA